MIVGIIAVSALLSVLVGNYAKEKGQPWATYFVLSLVLSPVIGFVLAAVAESKTPARMKKCPECAEAVQVEAKICRFCGYRFDAVSADPENLEAAFDDPDSAPESGCLPGSGIGSTVAADNPENKSNTSRSSPSSHFRF